MTNTDETAKQIAIGVAQKEIQKHKVNFNDYCLTDINPVQNYPGKYFVRFEVQDREDAKIEMTVDTNSSQVSGFKDSWA